MTFTTADIVIRLLLAIVVGGIIGAEREFRTGTGLRTLMLICLGSTLFTMYSDVFAFGEGDPRRIAAAVVTGVGFLGAGMILRQQGAVLGLTTAATVWLVAALGMGIGIGLYLTVGVATVLVVVVLWFVPVFLRAIKARRTLNYEAVGPLDEMIFGDISDVMKANHLHINHSTKGKEVDGIRYS